MLVPPTQALNSPKWFFNVFYSDWKKANEQNNVGKNHSLSFSVCVSGRKREQLKSYIVLEWLIMFFWKLPEACTSLTSQAWQHSHKTGQWNEELPAQRTRTLPTTTTTGNFLLIFFYVLLIALIHYLNCHLDNGNYILTVSNPCGDCLSEEMCLHSIMKLMCLWVWFGEVILESLGYASLCVSFCLHYILWTTWSFAAKFW